MLGRSEDPWATLSRITTEGCKYFLNVYARLPMMTGEGICWGQTAEKNGYVLGIPTD